MTQVKDTGGVARHHSGVYMRLQSRNVHGFNHQNRPSWPRLLVINDIQVLGPEVCDLGPELPELRAAGIDLLRLYPQSEGMADVVTRFHLAVHSANPPPRLGAQNGYWHGEPGMSDLTIAGEHHG